MLTVNALESNKVISSEYKPIAIGLTRFVSFVDINPFSLQRNNQDDIA